MPTILRWSFLFYSANGSEPPHVHARKGRQEVKFWLHDCSIEASRRLPQRELGLLRQKVMQQQKAFLERCHAHFG
jgi:Domain of unknown function (DUF4160)